METTGPSTVLAPLLAAAGLSLVHVLVGNLRFLETVPRSRWLSMAGGVSVAYVFLHILPELAAAQEAIRSSLGETVAFVEHHVYLVALLGLATFYGLERLALASRRRRDLGEPDATGPVVFWLHIASFAVYNGLIGYLLDRRLESGPWGLLIFVVAMALHFVVNDYGLREHHKAAYRRVGRWVLAAALFIGWGLGLAIDISEAALGVVLAFLAGGIVLNVLKEELPEERESRFGAFALGGAVYAALLLAS